MKTKNRSRDLKRYFVYQQTTMVAGAEQPLVRFNTADQVPTLLGRLHLDHHEHTVVKDWAWRAKHGNVLVLSQTLIVCFTKPPPVERFFSEEATLTKVGTEALEWGPRNLKAKGKKRYASRHS